LARKIFGEEYEIRRAGKEELERLMQKAIKEENYELAAKIRDLIKELDKEKSGDDKTDKNIEDE
jgi:protein-arginine kinase activator protein McsA